MENLVFSFLREGAVCVLGVQDEAGKALACSEAPPRAESSVTPNTDDAAKPVVLCKTLIQLDGDIVSWVSPAVLAKPELLDQHHDAVLRELRGASDQAQSWLQKVASAAGVVRWGGGTLVLGGNVTLWHALASVIVPLIISATSVAAWHFGTRFVITRLARRALRRLRALR